MTPHPGDHIEVTPNTLGVLPRHGVVVSSAGGGSLRVRWDDGHETVFVPGSDCRVVPPSAERSPAGVSPAGVSADVRLACQVDVRVVEDDDDCRATARVVTSRGVMEATGTARRRHGDPKIPLIGEELAVGRALGSLSQQLIAAASAHLTRPPSQSEHLVN